MSKVITAANAMIANQSKISDVVVGVHNHKEVFFIYDTKHKWSIRHDEDGIFLWYYPGNQSLAELAALEGWEDGVPMVVYSTKQLGTEEAYQTLFELYTVVREKIYGVDKALDEIIADLF